MCGCRMTERWDILDDRGFPTGETMIKGEEKPNGALRQVVHVCIFNAQGEMLIQQRSASKDIWPLLWDVSAAGSVMAGESPRDAAVREVREELGIDIDLASRRPNFTLDYPEGFDHFFLVAGSDLGLADLVLEPREVVDVRWASCDDVLQLHQDGQFAPFRRPAIRFIFDLAGRISILDGGEATDC